MNYSTALPPIPVLDFSCFYGIIVTAKRVGNINFPTLCSFCTLNTVYFAFIRIKFVVKSGHKFIQMEGKINDKQRYKKEDKLQKHLLQ